MEVETIDEQKIDRKPIRFPDGKVEVENLIICFEPTNNVSKVGIIISH